jgi:anti-anti-sigma regulatory factor
VAALGAFARSADPTMAFFFKISPKKPVLPGSGAKARHRSATTSGRGLSASELAAQHEGKDGERLPRVEPMGPEVSVTGASLIEWTPAQAAFEVAQANPGLCAGLENAALLYASGQAAQARSFLEESVRTDQDTKTSPLAWLALFDLLQRAGDKAAFEQLALQYVVQFERSSPAWEAKAKPSAAPRAVGGSLVTVSGKLTGSTASSLDGLKRTIANRVSGARLDLMGITGFDDAGARRLADLLADARRARIGLRLQRSERLKPMLDAALRQGRAAGEGAWLLALELLQWASEREAFEDRAVEFAVTFERSPPSWEPPVTAAASQADGGAAASPDGGATSPEAADAQIVRWSGVMAGSVVPQLGRLSEFAASRTVVEVDMSEVERVDFVCAGALLNAINRVETQRKSVQIFGASPIIRALLLLIGISPRHFVKKPQ